MLKKMIYRWHRRLSLIIALPLVLWAGSGLLYPIMTNIRPLVATQELKPVAMDSGQLRIPLQAALDSNGIAMISKARLVHIDSNWFYQVQQEANDVPVYMDTRTGKVLPKGDYLYAQYLARQFLEGQQGSEPGNRKSGSAFHFLSVTDETRLDTFSEEYTKMNRLLPVYRIAFDRPDGIRIYVETTRDRFAMAMDNKRAAFTNAFKYLHAFQWLGFLGKGRQIVEFVLLGLVLFTIWSGMYIFFITRSRRVPGNGYVRARRNHRYTAIVVSVFAAMFAFSGAWHLLSKLTGESRRMNFVLSRFPADSIRLDYAAVRRAVGRPIAGISLVAMNKISYWQVELIPMEVCGHEHPACCPAGGLGARGAKGKDPMPDRPARLPGLVYVRASDYAVLPDGDETYARYLATQFSGHPASMIKASSMITRFDRDYNMMNKRLPVWRVNYAVTRQERYYVETSTGRLSARMDDLGLLESYSFSFFHKHEFLAGLGKSVKDTSTVFWTAAQLLMVWVGLVLYVRARKRRRKKANSGIYG